MVKDALKFFHAYVNEMIEVGGENLPRAVSTKLGAKLAALYKEKGINNLTTALETAYKALGASTSIKKIDENTYLIQLKHSKKFCPIGGKRNPTSAKTIQDSICFPYTRSFLTSLFPEFQFETEIKECIVDNSNSHCKYKLKVKKRSY
ncbi:hypothetical protein ES705_03454 [subsurface metagenome]|nr:MAG: hypothetical protein CEE42_09045 [Candidatus Lokiarchaeota archaeon Loki_b31]